MGHFSLFFAIVSNATLNIIMKSLMFDMYWKIRVSRKVQVSSTFIFLIAKANPKSIRSNAGPEEVNLKM